MSIALHGHDGSAAACLCVSAIICRRYERTTNGPGANRQR
jgi:hypothetical protein